MSIPKQGRQNARAKRGAKRGGNRLQPGPARFLVLAAGLVLTVAYLRRSYAISVLGISMVSVIAYAHVDAPLGEALLYRGLDTLIGAFIAIVVTLLIPVGSKPKPVWASESG